MKSKNKYHKAINLNYHRLLNEENINEGVEELLNTFEDDLVQNMNYNNAETLELLIRFHLTIFTSSTHDMPVEGKMAVAKYHLERFNGVMIDYIKHNSMQ